MKQHLTHILLTAGLSALLGTAALSAQDRVEVADVPFAFHANNQILPAGTYKVREYARGVFMISDADAHSMFISTPDLKSGEAQNPRLIFRCYGNERVLSQIWLEDGSGYGLGKSSLEKNRKLEMATLVAVRLKQR
jgi:hypothetical protein